MYTGGQWRGIKLERKFKVDFEGPSGKFGFYHVVNSKIVDFY